MIIEKAARPTLTTVELNVGDELHFALASGGVRRIRIISASAGVYASNLDALPKPGPLAKVVLQMNCKIEIDGVPVALVRTVGSQASFYEPWELFGMRIWFDGCQALFEHLTENHGACKPRKQVRLAVQDATLRICPVLLHPWCPLPEGGLRIEDCYQGSDCWLGPYFGIDAHGGLDINHAAGTPLWTPIAVDEQAYFESVATGANNNRWRGIKRWADGSSWVIQAHHIIRLLHPEHTPLEAGLHYAETAGVWVGSHEHTHFAFAVVEPGGTFEDRVLLDPWILFWQMYRDRQTTRCV
jgi:hypothetical protein